MVYAISVRYQYLGEAHTVFTSILKTATVYIPMYLLYRADAAYSCLVFRLAREHHCSSCVYVLVLYPLLL